MQLTLAVGNASLCPAHSPWISQREQVKILSLTNTHAGDRETRAFLNPLTERERTTQPNTTRTDTPADKTPEEIGEVEGSMSKFPALIW